MAIGKSKFQFTFEKWEMLTDALRKGSVVCVLSKSGGVITLQCVWEILILCQGKFENIQAIV